MADTLTPAERSERMKRIRGENTAPELKLRKALHARGLRYKLHDKRLPGSPDIVFTRYRAAIFVNGCFWHRHHGCKIATTPKSNTSTWQTKFERNVQRDAANAAQLTAAGWNVIVVWECELTSIEKIEAACERVLGELLRGLHWSCPAVAEWFGLDLKPVEVTRS